MTNDTQMTEDTQMTPEELECDHEFDLEHCEYCGVHVSAPYSHYKNRVAALQKENEALQHEINNLKQAAGAHATLPKDSVQWIVNDVGELGVKIGDVCYFLYKGESLIYASGKHDDGGTMYYRNVLKREFGECCVSPRIDDLRSLAPDKKSLVEIDDGPWHAVPPQQKVK